LRKKEVLKRFISVFIVIGCFLLVLGLLSLFNIVNMDAMPPILLSAGIFNITNGYYVYIKNKKSAILLISSGLFSAIVSVFIFFR
jgi:hypothetical protein